MHLFKKKQVNFHQLCNYISLPRRESTQFGERLSPANFFPVIFASLSKLRTSIVMFFFPGITVSNKKRTFKETRNLNSQPRVHLKKA